MAQEIQNLTMQTTDNKNTNSNIDNFTQKNSRKEMTIKQLSACNWKALSFLRNKKVSFDTMVKENIKSIDFYFKPSWANKELYVRFFTSNMMLSYDTNRSIASAFLENNIINIAFNK